MDKVKKIFQALLKKKSQTDDSHPHPSEIYANLRRRVLGLANEKIVAPNEFGLYALVVEYLLNETVVTEVYVSDGSASLYFSNGGGRIGAGNHQSVRDATKRLFEGIGDSYKQFPTHLSPPLPQKEGITFFYFVSDSGIHAVASLTDDLYYSDHMLHKLFDAKELVKTEMRKIDSGN